MEKALENLSRLLTGEQDFWRDCLERVRQMPRANRLLKRIASAPSKEQLQDYLAEVAYALVFAGLGFEVEVEPRGKKGPDLSISRDGYRAVVEVRRLRPVNEIPVFSPDEGPFVVPRYENLENDLKKLFAKISEKFSQVGDDDAIIALWNDDDGYSEIQTKWVTDRLRDEAAHDMIGPLPAGLLFVLFRAKWIDSQEFFCFPLQIPKDARLASWVKKIEHFRARELVQRALNQSCPES